MRAPPPEPDVSPAPSAGALPLRGLVAWALFVPLAYAPSIAIGKSPDWTTALAVAIVLAISLLAIRSLAAGETPDRLAARLDPLAPGLLALGVLGQFVAGVIGAARGMARFGDYEIAGLFGQSFWTLLHGLPFANSAESVNGTLASHFALHFSPTLLLLTPFYALAPRPQTLMVAQALALALAPVPLFALLRRRIGSAAALPLALLPFALPIFRQAPGGDFHDSCFLAAPLLASVWALEARRPRALAIFVLLWLGVREDAGLSVAMLGVYAAIRGRGRAWAVALIVAGIGWFALATRVVVPAFATPGLISDPHRFFVDSFGHWGATPGEAARTLLTRPVTVVRWLARGEIVRYLHGLLLPLLFLPPLLDPAALPAVPALAINTLSRFPFMHAATQPYSYAPSLFLALATTGTAVRLAARAPAARRAATGLVIGTIVLLAAAVANLAPRGASLAKTPPASAARAVLARIPAGAPVYAPGALHPALARRMRVDGWANTTALARDAAFRARYAWIVLWPEADPPGEPRDAAMAESLAADPRFERLAGFEPLTLYRRR